MSRTCRGRCRFAPIVAGVALALLAAATAAAARAGEAPVRLPKPYVVVEAWLDRAYCSDLYAFDFDGKLLRRLTREPLPSCDMAAVSADGTQVTFVANASALYCLSVPYDLVASLHSGNVRAVAMTPDGRGVAYATTGFAAGDARWVLRVQPLVAGAGIRRAEVSLPQEPTELAFSPDGKQVLFTAWTAGRAEIFRCDLDAKTVAPFLTDPVASYYEPAYTRDGKAVVAVHENLDAGEWTIVSAAWPAGPVAPLRRGPRGVALSVPTCTADGKHVLFDQDGTLARMTIAGENAEGLSGELDDKPRPVTPRGLLDRPQPARPASAPVSIGQWVARLEPQDPDGQLVLIGVGTKERKVVPLPKGKLMRAVVVE